MSQLPLVIKTNFKDSHGHELESLKRNNNSIILEDLNGNFGQLFEALRHKLEHIKTAEIKNSDFTMEAFSEFLRRACAVEKLLIFRLEFPGSATHSALPPVYLPFLKSLHLESPDWGCLNLLKNSQIVDLALVFEFPNEIESIDAESHNDCLQALNINENVFKNFYESQRKVETMGLHMFPITLISCLSSFQCNFELKKLTMSFYDDEINSDGFKKIIALLNQHKATLEHLEIWKANEALMLFIFENLKLKELVVHNMRSIMNASKYKFTPNHHLQKLCIGRIRHRNTKFFTKMLEVYQSIQHLCIKRLCSSEEAVAFEAICKLPRIRHLEVSKLIALPEGCQPRSIPSLESLDIGELGPLGHGENFFIDFKGITMVSIGNIRIRNVLRLALPDTEHLKLGVFNRFLQSDYHRISMRCPNLRFLEFLEVGQRFRQEIYHNEPFKIIQNAFFFCYRRNREACCSECSNDNDFLHR